MASTELRWSKYNVSSDEVGGRVAVFNTLTQALVEFTTAEVEQIRNNAGLGTPIDTALLTELGFLVIKEADEFELASGIRRGLRRRPEEILDLVISPTLACNFTCTYCFHGTHHKLGDLEIAPDQAIAYATSFLQPGQHLNVTWYGGEPTLAAAKIIDWTRELRAVASERGSTYSAHLLTNGSKLSELDKSYFDEAGIVEIQVSMDWPLAASARRERHQTTSKATSNLLLAVSKIPTNINVLLRINVFPGFFDTFPECIALLKASISRTLVVYTHQLVDAAGLRRSFAHSDMNAFRHQQLEAKRMLRGAGFHQPYFPESFESALCMAQSASAALFSGDGRIHKCYSEVASAGAEVCADGSQNERAMEFSKADANLCEQCRNCAFMPICHGGCPKSAVDHPSELEKRCTPWRSTLASELTEYLRR